MVCVSQVNPELTREILSRILFKDRDILILDKPHGLAVQGGSKTTIHMDLLIQGALLLGLASFCLIFELRSHCVGGWCSSQT